MALLSALTLIRALSLFHLTLAFYFITQPSLVADQNIVYLLGESMHLPRTYAFDKPTAATSFVGLLFGLIGLADLTAASVNEIPALEYWGSQVPVRLVLFFGVTGYTYATRSSVAGTESWGKESGLDEMKNGLVFSWAFVELLMWFWIYITIREDRRQVVLKRM